MLCQKKNEKKEVNPASQNGRNEKKKFKKKPSNHISLWRLDTCQPYIQSRHLKRREWRKRRRKKKTKNESGSFFSKGVRLKIFFANRVRKKKKIP